MLMKQLSFREITCTAGRYDADWLINPGDKNNISGDTGHLTSDLRGIKSAAAEFPTINLFEKQTRW